MSATTEAITQEIADLDVKITEAVKNNQDVSYLLEAKRLLVEKLLKGNDALSESKVLKG